MFNTVLRKNTCTHAVFLFCLTGSSPDYRPFAKLSHASESSECRRRSLPVTPYSKPVSSYLRPPSGFSNMHWNSKLEPKSCRLPGERDNSQSACSSMSSLASQESGFGDYPFPMELSNKVRCKGVASYIIRSMVKRGGKKWNYLHDQLWWFTGSTTEVWSMRWQRGRLMSKII